MPQSAQSPIRPARGLAAALVAVTLLLPLSACDTLSFAVANLPAHFAEATRSAGVAFAPGPRGKLDVYRPAGARPGATRPVILFWYGGSWTSGNRGAYRFAAAALSELGYVVVVPDYRLYPEVRFPAFLDDGAAAVAWVQQHIAAYGGDPQQVVLMGHSAGAYTAAMLGVEPSYLSHAGADPSAVIGLITLSGPMLLRPNTPTLNAIFSAPYAPADWQATARVARRGPPTLVIHGRDDTLVGQDNAVTFVDRLRAQGGEVILKLYDHCDHVCTLAALSVPARHRAPTLTDVAEFLATLSARRPGSPP
jgi:acetyl esterase/lipase